MININFLIIVIVIVIVYIMKHKCENCSTKLNINPINYNPKNIIYFAINVLNR